MKLSEAKEVMLKVAAFFPGRLPSPTQAAWAEGLVKEKVSYEEAIEAVPAMAKKTEHPSMKSLLEAVHESRVERERQRVNNASFDRSRTIAPRAEDTQRLRSDVARELAGDMVLRRNGCGPWTDYDDEFARRLRDLGGVK